MGKLRTVSQESKNLLTLKMTERAAVAGPFHAIALPLIVAASPSMNDKSWAWWSVGVLGAIAVLRIVIWYFTNRLLPTARGRWIHRIVFGSCSLALALAWSLPAYIMISQQGMNVETCILVIAVSGVATVAVPAFSNDLPVIVLFLQLMFLPVVMGLGTHFQGAGYKALAVGFVLYDLFMSFLAVHMNRFQVNNMRQLEEISSLHRTLETMVESLGEAFLLIDRKGRFRPTNSKRAHELLGRDPSDLDICEVLAIPETQRASMRDWVTLCFEDRFEFDDLAALGPQRFGDDRRGITLELRYRPLRDAQKRLRSIVLVGRDITRELQAQQRAEDNNLRAEMILTVLKNPTGFREFQEFARTVLIGMRDGRFRDMSSLRMDLHTLKGNAGMFRIVTLSEEIHRVEQELRQMNAQHLTDADRARISALSVEMLGVVDAWLTAEKDFLELASSLRESARWDLGRYLETFSSVVAVTAKRLRKNVRFEVTADQSGFEVPLPKGHAPAPLRTLVHVLNNAIDHGIEIPEIREDRGKPVTGVISVRYSSAGEGKVGIRIRDDGAGISREALRRALARKNVSLPPSLSDHDLFQYVFHEGLSTREEVTEISGHGVGMSAVKAAVENAGGHVEVVKSDRQGTEIFIELPQTALQDGPRAVA